MKCKAVVVGLLIIFGLPVCLLAQTASIGGTITDSTGAGVPNAKISGVTTLSSGLPFEIFASFDTQHTGLVARPDLNKGVTVPLSNDRRTQTGPSLALFSTPLSGQAATWAAIISVVQGSTIPMPF